MPPEIRLEYESAIQQIDKKRNGVPDFLEGKDSSRTGIPLAAPSGSFESPQPAIIRGSPQPPVIAPQQSNNRLLVAVQPSLCCFYLWSWGSCWISTITRMQPLYYPTN